MIPDLDIFRGANVIMKQYGQDAPIHAAMRADAMLEAGDLNGYAVWKRILRAVEELQGTDPAPGAQVHLAPTPGVADLARAIKTHRTQTQLLAERRTCRSL